jgi:hypothetical protein
MTSHVNGAGIEVSEAAPAQHHDRTPLCRSGYPPVSNCSGVQRAHKQAHKCKVQADHSHKLKCTMVIVYSNAAAGRLKCISLATSRITCAGLVACAAMPLQPCSRSRYCLRHYQQTRDSLSNHSDIFTLLGACVIKVHNRRRLLAAPPSEMCANEGSAGSV